MRALAFLLVIAACNSPERVRDATTTEQRPNFVVVLADDMGWADLTPQGAQGFATPRLDAMATDGTRFTDFYSVGPVCTPTRAALLTGCYPKRLGLGKRVLFPFSETGLNPDEETLAEILAAAGYRTACIGKWHLGHHEEFMPLAQGFQRFFGVPYSNDMDRHYYASREFQAPPLPLYDQSRVIEESPDQALLTRRFTDEAIRFIESAGDAPFFLYVAHVMPHQPIAASANFVGGSELGLYGDVIQELDHSVGRILDALETNGVADQTCVLFTSDNGPWRQDSSGILRGKKNTTFEGGVRVPCVVRWPGVVEEARVSAAPWSVMDLLPTFALHAGAELPDAAIDGMAIDFPSLENAPPRTFGFWRDDRLQAVRHGKWKLHTYRPEWKEERSAPLLFDLSVDPGETRDVAGEHPEVVGTLQAEAQHLAEQLGDAVTGLSGTDVRSIGMLRR